MDGQIAGQMDIDVWMDTHLTIILQPKIYEGWIRLIRLSPFIPSSVAPNWLSG